MKGIEHMLKTNEREVILLILQSLNPVNHGSDNVKSWFRQC
jgi:hypothetical protein